MIYECKRTHRCGTLRAEDVGKEVVLMGWVATRRDLPSCVFVDLRDREGVTQLVFDPEVSAEAYTRGKDLRREWVIGIVGEVRGRGGNVNDKLSTGAIEVAVKELEVFSQSQTPPFVIEDEVDASEELRLKHRYLDLRRPVLQRNLRMRHRFNQLVRSSLDADGFYELETPFLIRSTPEGARDYVVPSRVHGGSFFALPQSPQLFKQLLMVAGYDRYFQIVRCFRDEDLRAERQPEFTQVDVEMSFVSPSDIQLITEKLLARVWKELLDIDLKLPFERITYDESMRRFGVDAPDLRFDLELIDVSEVAKSTGFAVFAGAVEKGGCVKAINLRGTGDWSRNDLDKITEFVKVYGAKGLAWLKVKDDHTWQSPIAKFFSDEDRSRMSEALGLQPGDVAVFVADNKNVANAALGNLRKYVAKERGLIAEGTFRFCWVTEFPLFEWDADTRRFYAAHHPFTSPRLDDVDKLESDPGAVKAVAYDVALNGIEIGGGSIRIHDGELQRRVFDALGIGEEEAQEKFGFLLDAFKYGAPPHGGIALGVDRIMMLLCGTDSIRDVIAFPKTARQTDLMLNAPAPLDAQQLAELSICTVKTSE